MTALPRSLGVLDFMRYSGKVPARYSVWATRAARASELRPFSFAPAGDRCMRGGERREKVAIAKLCTGARGVRRVSQRMPPLHYSAAASAPVDWAGLLPQAPL